ncbi:4665_t:CDS:2 [Cetraspora pellucida]|uniref:4665_t:CDS:1 n=1 Tax=Cetraspora pellucida TaxID=1433469 RepID=A0ACA9LJK1_9GLOM|nr:4665_t:CDS:2 [Cetraspora pellucida]
MSKVSSSHSSSPSKKEQPNRIPIIQQKIILKNETHLLWNSSVNTRAKTIP